MHKLDKIYKNAKKIDIYKHSKIVIASDCHRGIDNINDNFAKNKWIYKKALKYYYDNGFTYIELGDGDEMWEVKNYNKIIEAYPDIFKLLKKFYQENRFFMLYGNHDICKRNKKVLKKYFYNYYDYEEKRYKELFTDLEVYEAIVLDYFGFKIFLLHGHQVDFFNSTLWKVSRFLVKHVWKKLEHLGIKTISFSKNYKELNRNEKKLERFGNKKKTMVIAGHTHNAIYPTNKKSLYYNDGSCVNKDGITCIEIENGKISLIKWFYNFNSNNTSLERKVIIGNRYIYS